MKWNREIRDVALDCRLYYTVFLLPLNRSNKYDCRQSAFGSTESI